jgi:CheY-like chemotaxis protein
MSSVMNIDAECIFLFLEGKQLGPFEIDQAESIWQRHGAQTDSWYWSPGMAAWQPANELFSSFSTQTPTQEKFRILAVDDDPIIIEILKLTLGHGGYEFRTAPDMLPACQLLEAEGLGTFDCVVTDYNMPGGSGLDLVRWIKQRDESLQVLLLTAKDDKQLVKAGLRAGIYDFLEKPLMTERFMAALQGGIELTGKRREEKQALLDMVRIRLSGHGSLAEEVIGQMAARESNSGSLLLKLDSIIKYSRRLEESNQLSSGMKGELGDLNLVDIIQLLTQAGKNGKLDITPHPAEGLQTPCEIYFRDGKFYHVQSGSKSGIHALQDLLQCQRGAFHFFYGKSVHQQSIEGDPIAIMLMVSAEIDETRNGRTGMPKY